MPDRSTFVPLDLALRDPDGSSVTLGDVLDQPLTLVQLVRYFGCLPCQQWLLDLDVAAGRLAALGIGAVAVGGSADYQAAWLREEKGVRMPLLLDDHHEFRDAVGAAQPLGWRLVDPRGAAAYARSLGRGLRPQAITRDTVRSPGVVVLDRRGTITYRHVGARIGDYPPLSEVLTSLGVGA